MPRTGWGSATSPRKAQLPADWASRRAAVIARDHGHCVWCAKPGTDVDHIERGTNHDLTNLRLLCRSCHMRRTGRDGGRTKRKPKRQHRPQGKHPGAL